MAHRILFLPGDDSNLRLAGLRHVLSVTLATSAAVTFTVVLSGRDPGLRPDLAVVHDARQHQVALWVDPLINSMVLTQDQHYEARLTADAGGGTLGLWRVPIKTIVREVMTVNKVYALDVDETLEVSKGPVRLSDLATLVEQGHIVGLCGNWAMVTLNCTGWHHIFSFLGPCGLEKHEFLKQLRDYIPGDDYVMVGNILGISGASDDSGAAERASWRFIQEIDFSKGAR